MFEEVEKAFKIDSVKIITRLHILAYFNPDGLNLTDFEVDPEDVLCYVDLCMMFGV